LYVSLLRHGRGGGWNVRTLKNTFGELGALLPVVRNTLGVLGALLPILYFGGLLNYFEGFGGSDDDVIATGLGPTVIGLKVMMGVCIIFMVFKVWTIVRGRYRPKLGSQIDPDGPPPPRKDGFDPEAIVARYIAQQSATGGAHADPGLLPSTPAPGGSASGTRPRFGRKSG
jgi:hypothetical protein